MILKTAILILFITTHNAEASTNRSDTTYNAMHKLCIKSENVTFTPLDQSKRIPFKDSLLNAIEMGESEKVEKLLNNRHPDSIFIHGMTPMLVAAFTGNWEAGKILLKAGANPNHKNPPDIIATPLDAAIMNKQFSFACNLMKEGASLPKTAEEKNHLMREVLVIFPNEMIDGAIMLNHFLENGFSSNHMGSDLETPLMRAVSVNSIPAIKVLLKHGARLDIVKQDGRTVWTVAREKNNPQVLKLLKEAQKKTKPKKHQPAALVPATV